MKTFWLHIIFVMATLGFYLLGNDDGEKCNLRGLIIWIVCVGVVIVWNLSKLWIMRGE